MLPQRGTLYSLTREWPRYLGTYLQTYIRTLVQILACVNDAWIHDINQVGGMVGPISYL